MANRKRNKGVLIYFSDEELAFMKQKMEQVNIGVQSCYIRKMALDGYIILKNYDELVGLSKEVNKIGVNINQVVHRIHNKDNIDLKITEDIEQLEVLLQQVHKCLNVIIRQI